MELAPADLDRGADGEQPVREAGGNAAERGGAEPIGLIPVTDREQRLDLVRGQQSAVDPVPADHLEPRLPQARRFPGPSQRCQYVSEIDVRAFQAEMIVDLLGELHGVANMGDTLVAAAEAGQIDAEHGECPDLRLGCAELPGQGERLLGYRQRFRIATGHHQPARE